MVIHEVGARQEGEEPTEEGRLQPGLDAGNLWARGVTSTRTKIVYDLRAIGSSRLGERGKTLPLCQWVISAWTSCQTGGGPMV